MEKDLKGISNKISVKNDEIFIKQVFIKETFNIKDIKSLSIKKPSGNSNGEIGLVTQKNSFQLFYKAKQFEYDELYNYLCERIAAISRKDIAKVQNETIEKVNGLYYCGGHPLMPDERKVNIETTKNLLIINYLLSAITINYSDIKNIRIETQEQIGSRFTATRIALLGPFALAFKKKKVTKEKYLTIDFVDSNGTELTSVFSGQVIPNVYSIIYKCFTDYKSINIDDESHINIKDKKVINDPYEELKKLKELLDIEAITQEEFDIKKKELLGL